MWPHTLVLTVVPAATVLGLTLVSATTGPSGHRRTDGYCLPMAVSSVYVTVGLLAPQIGQVKPGVAGSVSGACCAGWVPVGGLAGVSGVALTRQRA